MANDARLSQALIAKISALPPGRVAEVEDFVDFIRARDSDHALTGAAVAGAEPAFTQVWNNPDDDVYDAYERATC